jgi:hypothetical protein
MIRFQIIEQPAAQLQKTLVKDMRSGKLRTFRALRRGRRVQHITYPGWLNWSEEQGLIECEILSPRRPGYEWQLFSAFIGRLADRYADRIVGINVQFPDGGLRRAAAKKRVAKRGAKRARRG